MAYPFVASQRAGVPHWPMPDLFVTTRAAVNSTQTDREPTRPPGRNYMTSRRAAIVLIAIGVSAFASIGGAGALDYPTRPVRWVVGYPPGGATDIIARLIAQRLSERLRPPLSDAKKAR